MIRTIEARGCSACGPYDFIADAPEVCAILQALKNMLPEATWDDLELAMREWIDGWREKLLELEYIGPELEW